MADYVLNMSLYTAPDCQLSLDPTRDPIETLKEYLETDKKSPKIVGRLIYLKGAIDFYTMKFGDIDEHIAQQNRLKNMMSDGDDDSTSTDFFRRSYENGNETYAKQSDFKANWEAFCEQYFNASVFDSIIWEAGIGG